MTERFIYQNNEPLSDAVIRENLKAMLDERGPLKKVLLIPPDLTRMNSYAGPITRMLFEMLT